MVRYKYNGGADGFEENAAIGRGHDKRWSNLMGFLDRFNKSPEAQEKRLSGLEMENEVVSKQAEVEEKKAIIAQLKKQYGRDWMKTLGLKNVVDLTTLRSVLKGGTGLSHLRGSTSLEHFRRM